MATFTKYSKKKLYSLASEPQVKKVSKIISDLSLSHCESVTDEGIRQLCEGELRLSLESIDLDNCPLLSDAALRSLSNCPKLRNIELIDCLQISKAGIDALRKKLVSLFF